MKMSSMIAMLFVFACAGQADATMPVTSASSSNVGASTGLTVISDARASGDAKACSDDEHARYVAIVCELENTCGCSETVCELDWCSDKVHEWKKQFGACQLEG